MRIKNQYGFENGLSGWLSIDGEFISVKHGKHDEIAYQFEEERNIPTIFEEYRPTHGERLFELSGFIKFVCPDWGCDGNNSNVFFSQVFGYKGEVSEKQLDFLFNNLEKMTTNQEKDVEDFLKNCL